MSNTCPPTTMITRCVLDDEFIVTEQLCLQLHANISEEGIRSLSEDEKLLQDRGVDVHLHLQHQRVREQAYRVGGRAGHIREPEP